MHKKGFFYLVLILMSLGGADARAEEGKFSWGLGVGNSQFELNKAELVASNTALTGATSFEDSSTAFNLFGGMRLDQYLSLELDLLFAGDVVARDAGRSFKLFDVSSFAATLALSRQVYESTRLFARLGVSFWDISESAQGFDTINSGIDLTYGLGADINLYGDRSRQLRVLYNHYEYDGIFIDSSDTFTLGLLFLIGG